MKFVQLVCACIMMIKSGACKGPSERVLSKYFFREDTFTEDTLSL